MQEERDGGLLFFFPEFSSQCRVDQHQVPQGDTIAGYMTERKGSIIHSAHRVEESAL